jgi:hypothetical protein
VTDRIHDRSAGIPRLINVIADATLVFGYGEERSEIDDALIKDVIVDLDDTGVLGLPPNPDRNASVVPVEPTPAFAGDLLQLRPEMPQAAASMAAAVNSAPAAPRAADTLELLEQQLIARERKVEERERDVVERERELSEQRRVLAEQHRILRSAVRPAVAAAPASAPSVASPAAIAAPAAAAPAANWPPREPAAARPYRYIVHRREPRSMWRRMRDTLFGIEPVLE